MPIAADAERYERMKEHYTPDQVDAARLLLTLREDARETTQRLMRDRGLSYIEAAQEAIRVRAAEQAEFDRLRGRAAGIDASLKYATELGCSPAVAARLLRDRGVDAPVDEAPVDDEAIRKWKFAEAEAAAIARKDREDKQRLMSERAPGKYWR